MSLAPGTRLGSYEVQTALGAGGMGEVYRARDTRLGRDVALKILPTLFANDPERLARFEREAKTLASLNHPHIAHIHGFEESGSIRALVMELVEGEDLSARIKRGALPLDEALPIAHQIADALQAAHEQGIVHRDLKPANIKVRPDGTVKVLDFGLAKAIEPLAQDPVARDFSPANLLNSPTITSPAMTLRGMILGTAAYMAPEQAKGKSVDKRADIWAFGCVLYEMVTGQRPFPGDDVSETLASVIKSEPEWTRVPVSLRRLLTACLEKDPNRRLRDIGDVWKLVDDASASPVTPPVRHARIAWAAAVVALVAAGALAVVHFRESPPVVEPVRFQIAAPENNQFDFYLALSPDARRLAFTARDTGGTVRLWVHDLRTLESRALAGTEQAWSPFWSPDGRALAFAVGRQLKKIDLESGVPQLLCEIEHNVGSGSWNADDVIIFGSRLGGPIYRVPAAGGRATAVTAIDAKDGEQFHAWPAFLPDGKHFIYLRQPRNPDERGVFVGSLDVEPARQSTSRVVQTAFGASYAGSASGAGWLLFVREGTLVAQAFDPVRLRVQGDPQAVVGRIGGAGSAAFFSTAGPAALVYREGTTRGGAGNDLQLTWVDRQGKTLGEVGERGPVSGVALSPDNSRIALGGALSSQTPDIWMIEVARNLSTRVTFDGAVDTAPVWSPDGTRIVFRSNRKARFDLYERSLSAEEDRVVLESDRDKTPTDWSRDGRFILYDTVGLKTRTDVWALPLQNPAQPIPVAQSEFDERAGSFSPDGRWITYSSDESGRPEIYVRSFSATPDSARTGEKIRISRDGAARAKWSADGREIFFRGTGGAFMSAPVKVANGVLEPGMPVQLFTTRAMLVNAWDVATDGKRFLVGSAVQEGPLSTPITAVLNWQAALGR